MKNTLMIIIAFITFTLSGQNDIEKDKQFRQENRNNFTPEQKAELHSKKLTLELDLTDSQQKEIKKLLLDHKKQKSSNSEKRKDISVKNKYEGKKTALDRRIIMKREFKKILTSKQYEKWESDQQKRKHPHKMRMSKHKKERKEKK